MVPERYGVVVGCEVTIDIQSPIARRDRRRK
jgi:hypothetical protein